ncbi:MAG TPA: hypothetical protein VF017_16295 [Thermoanaerobaculia bacterium]|nr:hypothetical protein [Thermoanaerobaculia bacterium]
MKEAHRMRVLAATVIGGKFEIPAETFGEGQEVLVIATEPERPVRLTAEEEQELLDAIAGIQREEYVDAADLLEEIRAQRLSAWEGIRDLVENPRVRVGGQLPDRDEVHRR